MKLDVPVRDLGEVAIQPLLNAVLNATADEWLAEPLRQERYEQHHDTESLILCFCDGWPNLRMMKGSAWDRYYPRTAPIVADILGRGYTRGGKVVRLLIANLKPGGHIPLHADTHPSFDIGHRIHVPLQTNDQVEFTVGGQAVMMICGRAYEIDNKRNHEVYNRGTADRFHLIFDYVPPDALEEK